MLHYIRKGQINANCIVFVHGFPNDHTCWESILPGLESEFDILLINLPGAGGSKGVEPKTLTTSYMAQKIEELMSFLKIEQFVLIGHSMGGYTAMEYLSQFPNRLKGVSMVHSLASADEPEKKKQREKAIDLIYRSRDGQRNFLKTMAKNLFPTNESNYNELVEKVVNQGMKLSQDDIVNFYHAIMYRNDNVKSLLQNNIPIQWIIGEKDLATPMEIALTQSYLANVNDIKIYRNVGHMGMYECPKILNSDLSEFCHFCFKN